MPTDDIPHKLVRLLLELIESGELPKLAVGGAWLMLDHLLTPRPALGPVPLEADMCGLAVAGLRAVGPAADWVVSLVSSLVVCEKKEGVASARSAEMTGLRCCGCRASHAATQVMRGL
jgi:hypothetical protein|eukprot:COSAG06_NODE_5263_length_3601_cov_6.246716_3_plen_118_part_00